ncbi:MAG: pilin protein MshC [Betaproteobacteria bacterium]|jgi:MSHA pilin protein MshC|nr:pilin protein MshC [Betaproteobacteria bacterium]
MTDRGFSLIELVVVMIIAAILAALAIPRFTDSESKATWYHEQVMAAVRYAQRQAVAQHRNIYVCVTAGTSVSVSYDPACAGTPSCPSSASTIQIPQQLCAPSNTTLSSSITPFSFNALGQPSPIGGVTVTVGGRTVNVTGETGYVFPN